MKFLMEKNLLIIFVIISLFNCAHFTAPPEIQPYENLLSIIADFNSHLNDDFYSFPYPRDVSGQNLYKATIVRILNYRSLLPEKSNDIINYTLGLAYEKLGDYTNAIDNYKSISEDSELKGKAKERLAVVEEFHSIVDTSPNTSSLRLYLDSLEKKNESLEALVKKYTDTEYEPLALVEQELADIEYTLFLIANKYIIKDGVVKSITQLKDLTKKYWGSKNIYDHYLRLGDFYFDMAKEYSVLYSPQLNNFSTDEFEKYINSARNYYFIVDQADGSEEKPEARAKLAALASFADKINKLSK